jgi:hypothetical protein
VLRWRHFSEEEAVAKAGEGEEENEGYVNRTWSVLIGKYEFVCCAEQTITYKWTSD